MRPVVTTGPSHSIAGSIRTSTSFTGYLAVVVYSVALANSFRFLADRPRHREVIYGLRNCLGNKYSIRFLLANNSPCLPASFRHPTLYCSF